MKKKRVFSLFKIKEKSYFFLILLLLSCTSNTIFKKPKDLIPKDTMSLLMEQMMIASSAKFIRNKNKERNINYMPFIYNRFKIDSTRFQNSNFYYMSKIDLYQKIITDAQKSLKKKEQTFKKLSSKIDSIRRDSVDKKIKRLLDTKSRNSEIYNLPMRSCLP